VRRAPLLAVLIAAALAAPAHAWQELPFRALPAHDVATCLDATGADGGVAALGPLGRATTPVDLLSAGPGGLSVRERVRFPIVFACPEVREQGGAGVVTAVAVKPGTHRLELRAAGRDPGGAFGAPVPLGRAGVVQ
jgi:hypothetical protein